MSLAKYMSKENQQLAREFSDRLLKAQLEAAKTAPKRVRKSTNPGWPMVSQAMGCHPEQVAEFQRNADAHNLTGVKFRPDGACVFEDSGAKRDYMKLRDYIDKS